MRLAPALAALLLAPAALHAQRDIARADSLLRAGRVTRAEALYYAAARQRPRDPAARLALGRYIASRGATRVGAVLIEEAWRFGASPGLAATHLAPLYARLADWEALAKLEQAPLSAGERARARWLVQHPSATTGADSTSIPLHSAAGALGEVIIRVGSDELRAAIDPRPVGLVLDGSAAGSPAVSLFTGGGADSRQAAAVATRVQLGDIALANEPVKLDRLGAGRAIIGVDLLARYAATVDPRTGTLLLRRDGRVRPAGGTRLPLVFDAREVRAGWQGSLEPLGGGALAGVLTSGRWTIDAKRGELVLE